MPGGKRVGNHSGVTCMSSRQRFLLLALVAALGGCQAMAPQDPLGRAPGALPAECTWPRSDEASRQSWVRASVEALETRGFTIRHTDTQLGVISAERKTRLRGLGAVDRPWYTGSAIWGSLGRSSGVALGYGVRFGDDPVQVERLSVVIGEADVRITRDSSVIDPDGYLVDARPDNRSNFCREISASIDARARAAQSQLEAGQAGASQPEASSRTEERNP